MKVSRLPVDTGISGWAAILPEAEQAISLQSDIKAEYLIIGAGFAGLSAARRLRQLKPNSQIVLLEATRVGEGPAGRNSGFMIDLPHELTSADYATNHENDLAQIKLNRQAIAFAADAVKEYGLSEEAFDPCGKINGARAEKAIQHNLDYAKHLDDLAEPYELLDAVAMKTLTGSDFYQSGIYTPGTAMLQPVQYVHSLAKGLGNSVSIFENSPVISLEREGNNWFAKTSGGSVKSPKVILATNGHIESFGHFKRRLVHIMLYASMTRALSAEEDHASGEARWGVTPSDPSATTMRKISGTGGARIITRNRVTYSPNLKVMNSVLTQMAKTHDASFKKRYPQLSNVEQEYQWAGRLCLSRNGVSAFGEIEPGLYSACCQNGLGTARGTLSGMAAAELAVEGETELTQSFLKQEQPQKLPPAPLDSIGATALMKFEEWKAREEL